MDASINPWQDFPPPRRTGLVLHGIAGLALGSAGGLLLWLAVQQTSGSSFLLMILVSLLLLTPVPFIAYYGFALIRSNYQLSRDGLRLSWGLRAEDISLPEIEWMRPASDLVKPLPLPWLRLPGTLRGIRRVAGLGLVEYLASDTRRMLLVAAADRVFVISPADPEGFQRAYQRVVELGSLSPLESATTQPTAYISRVWRDRAARLLIMAGLLMLAGLMVQTSLIIPSHASISLGYDAFGRPNPPGPPESLFLLPVLAILMYVFNLMLGFYFYRKDSQRFYAYLLWSSSVVSTILLLAAAAAIPD